MFSVQKPISLCVACCQFTMAILWSKTGRNNEISDICPKKLLNEI